MTETTHAEGWLARLIESAERSRHRFPLLLTGGADWRCAWVERLTQGYAKEQCLRLDSDNLSTTAARRLLGREFAIGIISGTRLPAPDLLAIVAGTLRGGGLLVLALECEGSERGAFDRWLKQQLSQDDVLQVTEGLPLPPVPAVIEAPPTAEDKLGCLTGDQHRAVDGLLQVVHGHRRRPLVITAERGRGKSSALGIAAALLLAEGRRLVLVTAPKLSAVDALFQRAQVLLPDAEQTKGVLRWQQGEIRYLAPDQLLQQQPSADLLLVDEAAAIPAPLLTAMLERYARIAFATTTCGYEGTGRGFDIRFRPLLSSKTPGWRNCLLQQPVRWAEADPLERWLYRTLLLDAEAADFDSAPSSSLPLAEQCQFETLSGEQLLARPAVLQQLFALLVQAHYQTTPNDLRDLLQGEGMQVWLLRYRDRVAGGVLTVREGGLSDALATDIWLGQRRPPGHLLPQTLVAQSGWLQAAALSYLRIIRIAVHPDLQRYGLGRLMLDRLAEAASGYDLLGASFAASDHLPRFWSTAGHRPLRLGLQRDAASGCHSLLVARPLTSGGEVLVAQVEPRFHHHLLAQLSGAYRDVDPALLAELLAGSVRDRAGLDLQDRLDLTAYVLGGRGFEQAEPALQRLLLQQLQAGWRWSVADEALLVRRILQRHGVAECCQWAGLAGRRPLEQRLRNLLLPVVKRNVVAALPAELQSRVAPLLDDEHDP